MIPRSERLRFRRWSPDDEALAVSLWCDPEVTRFLRASPASPADAVERLRTELANQDAHGFQYWPVFAEHDFIGVCGLKPHHDGVPELGFHLRPAYWGRGYATEAARAVIAVARDSGAIALFAGHHPENEGSKRVLLRLGFRWTHDEPYPPTGRIHPAYLLDL